MLNIILFSSEAQDIRLRPFSYSRPIGAFRLGIDSLAEKWQALLGGKVSHFTAPYLAQKYPCQFEEENLLLRATVLPSPALLTAIEQLQLGESLADAQGQSIALKTSCLAAQQYLAGQLIEPPIQQSYQGELVELKGPWDLFRLNDDQLRQDFERMKGQGKKLSASNRLIGPEDQLYIHPTARVEGSILNTQTGPIYIGPKAQVLEGCMLRGPIALNEGAVLKMGAKVYGATTLGPYAKMGGEISNVNVFGYSNKGHDGFLGNAVLGEWCNLGADTNSSNLKNNYGKVKVWNYAQEQFEQSDLQFCGLLMGDHSKTGINSMLNTATTVGFSANLYGADFPEKFIPSFAWGSKNNWQSYSLDKAMQTAERMMQRRNIPFDEKESQLFEQLFLRTKNYRKWE
ncbi:UDP-N-acetylglucosamine diphosphorylase/glucosamine-1-phosphate N-acetyltransferase [Saprospira grandis DSM 2844]|uniref:UDP-N-acetylglucosamine diphosphorylase/glucosamine-1-phosphate N-acetyltransferase n=1 Tax=Saprospira grandis DSM 2844 TaxID=694433 RepID=J0P503_9BACT|nr:putative sugar nucleotidyl transferase [Saprospira grandis]EJF52512.1 UDP-N-acetylglucosamine diphosphorylase/glucosamine-1-phosphate N-acetyltransferase [Saprospira grandis DSM 2844]